MRSTRPRPGRRERRAPAATARTLSATPAPPECFDAAILTARPTAVSLRRTLHADRHGPGVAGVVDDGEVRAEASVSILVFALAGSIAQLVDGTLGMAFGITSSTLLVFLGATPVAASAAVHFAELGTTFASGASHWRFGNVDKRMLLRLGVSGAVGAFIGATVLSRISLSGARIWMSALLLILGIVLLARFGLGLRLIPSIQGRPRARLLVPLGLVAGFVDASGGGGWGPITTPTLLTATKTRPRRVIGTVSAAEFMVALAASAGFIVGATTEGVDWEVVAGLLLGGVLMAPFAAFLAGRLPHAPFGALIGGGVVLLNARIIMISLEVPGPVRLGVLLAVAALTVVMAWLAWQREHVKGVERSLFERAAAVPADVHEPEDDLLDVADPPSDPSVERDTTPPRPQG